MNDPEFGPNYERMIAAFERIGINARLASEQLESASRDLESYQRSQSLHEQFPLLYGRP